MTKSEAQKLIDEQMVVRKGEFSTGIDTILKSASKNDQIVEFQKRSDDVLLLSSILKCKPEETKLFKSFKSHVEGSELAKAMSTTGAATGLEWVPTGYSTQLMDVIERERLLAAHFQSFQMPDKIYEWPISTGRATTYKIAEGNSITASTKATAKTTFTAAKMAARVEINDELTEDSIVPMLSIIKNDLALSLVGAEEDCLINGCADASMDADNTDPTDHRRTFVGLRKLAIANGYTTDLSSFYADSIGPMRKRLGKFYVPNKCAWIVSTSGWEQLSRLSSDATGKYPLVITMDKLGNDATIKNGVLGNLFGSPVILSEFMRDTMTGDGYGTGIDTSMLLVRLDAFKIGYRGGLFTESDRLVATQQTQLVASQRMDFQPMFPISSNPLVWNGINITA